MRANISALPDGTYRCDDFLDNDGVTDKPLAIALDLTIAGDRMMLDFSRSAPPCDGPLNIARSTTVACCYVALKHLFTDVPANAGCLAPIEFVIPDTTLLGVSAPRPVGGYTETILRVIDVIFGAFAKAAPERANGSPFATINALSLAGWREHGRRWVMFCFFGGGLGGNPESDGLNHGNNPISTATIPPLEILELLYPVMFTQWALRPDSGGPGKHRGGLGAIYEIEALADGGAEVFLLGERGKYPPPGANGGGTRGAQSLRLRDRQRRSDAAARLQGHRREDQARPEGAAGNAGRRRLRRSRGRAIRRAKVGRARRAARLCVSAMRSESNATYGRHDRRARPRSDMSARMSLIVGIDVGGTFTDLFRFDSAARTLHDREGARRGAATRRPASSTACARSAACRRARSCTAPPSAPTRCWSGAARRSASSRRAASATCWKCAGATGAAPGACGATSRRSPIATCGSRSASERSPTARSARRSTWTESAPPRNGSSHKGAQAVAIIFINAYANAENERTRAGCRARVWPNDYVTASHEVLSEIREFERSSTAAINAYLQPVVASYIAKLEAALGEQSRRSIHIVQSNGGIMSTATARKPPRSHRAVRARRPASSRARRSPRRRASTISSPAISAAPRSTSR